MSERRQKDMDEKEAAFLQHAREFAEHMRNGRQRTREDWKRYEKAERWEKRKRKSPARRRPAARPDATAETGGKD